jgi:hypothetical protein
VATRRASMNKNNSNNKTQTHEQKQINKQETKKNLSVKVVYV